MNFWIAWNGFGDNSCGTIQSKISSGYPDYTKATHVRDGNYYFGDTYVGEFNLPVFIVINGQTKYVTCMASQDHDGGSNALSIAKTACDKLLVTGTMDQPKVNGSGETMPVTFTQKGSSIEFGNNSREAATVTLVNTQGRVVGRAYLSGQSTAVFPNLAPARYTAAVTVGNRTTYRFCAVGE